MEGSSLESLPEDLKMDIMSRLPLKSLVTCICVSKKWISLIRKKEFRDRYLHRSMTKPRLLFVASAIKSSPKNPDALLHSVYQEEEALLLSSGLQQMRLNDAPFSHVSQPIRGLICLQDGTEVVICNPGTRKVMTLPQIQVPNGTIIKSFFGYDEVSDVFKVLCITKFSDRIRSEVTKEYHVFTLGSGEELSWRQITCEHDHSPITEGLCKGDFLYYGANSNSDKSLVMSFNVKSEDFTVIELPEEVKIDHRWKLVNYNGNIALVNDSDFRYGIVNIWTGCGYGVFEIWVRNETAGNWWRNKIEIPNWEDEIFISKVFFKGTIGTGELAFAPYTWLVGQLFVVYYDPVTTNIRRLEIEGMVDQYHYIRTFLDHVDSTWLM